MPEQTLSVLLIEDDPAHAEITRRGLEAKHLPTRLTHVEDGQAALDYLFRQGRFSDPESSPRPDLILLDLRLPKVAGLEVLRRIKADTQLRRIPVVVLSTSAAPPDVLGAYSNQASSYLVKPTDYETFAQLFDSLKHYWLAWNRYPD
ncbi:response regulator [Marichromatium bheemlicum]|uniref:Response regulator n=1 Tax=Marichromatium bheemlicum TaxID=365339 RepID=A0ABX1I765_9GAMM|nr:response regulator [Marichromatium bheemlicum]NKN32070.1 response regulator [Marichromatium bheemlicum]